MVHDVLIAVVMCAAVFAGTFALLSVLFRAQVRGYDRTVATDLLDDWTGRLELLEPGQRERIVPPSDVVAAMVALPSRRAR